MALDAPADTGLVGRVLGDSLARRQGALGTGLARTGRGWVAFHVHQSVPDYLPAFDQARPQLAARRAVRRQQGDEEGARHLYDKSPEEFAGGDVMHFSRLHIPPQPVLTVPLSRAEIERYHRDHLDKYSAPEMVRASHILISPRDNSAAADREARARADSLLQRLRAREDFAEMARKVTDDPATKENGGDLGFFGRGAMLPEFERAAFAMRAGDLSTEPVRTQVGYHLIKVTSYAPMVAQPLVQVYANVSSDAAEEKADSLARLRADSLLRTLKNADQARAAARRLGLRPLAYQHAIGQREMGQADIQTYFQKLDAVKAGQLYPGVQRFRGLGYGITWVDSITPPRTPTWEQARDKALDAYRRGAGQRALDAKKAELDSLLQAGWSMDSLAAGWGGLERSDDAMPGGRLSGIGTSGRVDTLVFGLKGNDGLPAGRLSEWLDLPGGALRVRVTDLRSPDANALTTRVENDRRVETERALLGYFEGLKKRYPVRILDRDLRNVMLPQPPPR